MPRRPDVVVVGAGVSGLTTAVCLAEAGLAVQVRTRDRPRATTSCAAGAIWGPYLVEDDRALMWSELTRSVLTGLAREPDSGVRLRFGLEAGRAPADPPAWTVAMADFRPGTPGELPDGYATGWWYTAPVVDMPVYLDYLVSRLRDARATVEFRTVASLREAAADALVTINCAGYGARALVPDDLVSPNRGQLLVIDNPGVDNFFVEHEEAPDPVYYLPQSGGGMVLGGSAEPGRVDPWPDLAIAAAIQHRCARIEPLLAGARVREHRVGLRPSRPRVRLERTDLGGRHVIHNYGHGGSGVTLSWGCAAEVLDLVRQL